jgi:ribosomal protein S18 acetylase RimI-like enzyme
LNPFVPGLSSHNWVEKDQPSKGFLVYTQFFFFSCFGFSGKHISMATRVQTAPQLNNSQYVVRPARPDDIAAIQRVAREAWAATYAGIVYPEVQDNFINNGYAAPRLAQSISREGRDFWFKVAEITGDQPEIVGFAEVYLRPSLAPDAELTRIYLLPSWQKKGLGKALLESEIEELRALRPGLRPPRLWLSVAAENKKAIRFYEQRGFRFEKDFEATLPGQRLAMQEYVLEI